MVDAVVCRGRSEQELREDVRVVAAQLGASFKGFCFAAFGRAAASVELSRLPPHLGVDAVLRLLAVFSGASGASLWLRPGEGERIECVAAVGRRRSPDDRACAEAALAGEAFLAEAVATSIVLRFGKPAGCLVVARDGADRLGAAAFAAEAAEALERFVEHDLLVERNGERERAITGSLEKRLTRLAYDLHDGPLQELAALGADLSRMRRQVESVVSVDDRPRVGGRFQDIEARLAALDSSLRDMLDSVRGGSGAELDPPERRIAREVAAFRDATGVDIELEVAGDLSGLTESRQIALFRIVQEALANVREHSRAGHVRVRLVECRGRLELSVEDDGRGFDLDAVLLDAVRRGHFGLAGMRERIRLLGGQLDIGAASGGGTRVSFTLEPWQPLLAGHDAPAELAVAR